MISFILQVFKYRCSNLSNLQFSKKYISSRAGFVGSEATINGETLEVSLKSKSKFMMLSRQMDQLISDFVMNATGQRYHVNFIEPENVESSNTKQEALIQKIFEENALKASQVQEKTERQSKEPKVNRMPEGYGKSQGEHGQDEAYLKS